jgi:hypothetical protein
MSGKSIVLADALQEAKNSGFVSGDQKALISIDNVVPGEQEKQRKASEQRARDKDRQEMGLTDGDKQDTPSTATKKKSKKSKAQTEGT